MKPEVALETREQIPESDIDWCIVKAESSGALNAAANYCHEQAKLAFAALEKLPNHHTSSLLGELVDYLTIDRKA